MAEKNKLVQAVFILILCNIATIPFASSFAKNQTSASGANAFCLHSSLQRYAVLKMLCKENKTELQQLKEFPFATSSAATLT